MFELDLLFTWNEVKYYPYRTARVEGTRIKVNIRDSRDARAFIAKLAEMAGVREDNHVVYEIQSTLDKESNPLYVWVTDNSMYIGTKLIQENW